MLKKLNDFLAGLPMTIVAGAFLLLDFVPHLMEEFGGTSVRLSFLPFDPAWATIVISGIPLLYLAVWRIIHNPGISKISSALLICIAMFAAIAIGDLFAAGEVVFIMAIGALLEEATTNRAKKGVKKLISLAPTKGRRLKDGKEEMIPTEEIRQGDLLRILPGETIPVDGTILSGETSVDQSIMTGESLPIDKSVGEEVFCGTINRFGSIDISATKVGENSSLQKLIRMVQDAENKQAPMQRIADRAASWLVPVALLIAVLAYVFSGNIVTAVTVLVVFCPCALVLATPTAIMAAIGQATKHGVIIKSGEALEKMGKVDIIAFDKTGTLTKGVFKVSRVSPAPGRTEQEVLELAAAAESYSSHPISKSLREACPACTLQATDAREIAGHGVSAQVDGHTVLAGNAKLMEAKKIPYTPDDGVGTVVYLACDGAFCGSVLISDEVKPTARQAMDSLHSQGVRTVMLTGDSKAVAAGVAGQLGMDDFHAELLPDNKVRRVEELLADKSRGNLAFVGDGINDAPVLMRADIGIAMGALGSDAAIEAADVVLMDDDPPNIGLARRMARRCMSIVYQNIVFALGVKLLFLLLGAVGIANMWWAVFADVGVMVLAVLNATLMLSIRAYHK